MLLRKHYDETNRHLVFKLWICIEQSAFLTSDEQETTRTTIAFKKILINQKFSHLQNMTYRIRFMFK